MSLTTWVSSKLDALLAPAKEQKDADEPREEQASGGENVQPSDSSSARDDEETKSTLPVPIPPTAPVPSSPAKDGVAVPGRFVPSSEQSDITIISEAKRHTEHFRRVVDSFDEDKQTPLEWVIGQGAKTVCYVSPFIVAVFIGMGIGDKFAESQESWWMQIGIHFLSLFLEVLVPILGLATTITFKKALKDRSAIAGFLVVALFFLTVSIANSFALLMLLEDGFTALSSPGASVAVLGRSFGPLILDVGCAVYISVSTIKSLKKYLADKRQKILAIREVNAVELEMEETNQKAEMNRIQAQAEMESRQQRVNTFNEAERLTHEAVIASMRKKLMSDNDNDPRGRSRYSSW